MRGVLAPAVFGAHKILDKLPFTSLNKFSATISRTGSHTKMVLLGAPDVIFEYSRMSSTEKEEALLEIDRMAYEGNRVVGVAYKELSKDDEKLPLLADLKGVEFMGYLVFRDPLREDVKSAIKMVGEAGVRTIIVTGDHKGTAEAIATELGLVDGRGAVLTGHDLHDMDDAALAAKKDEIVIFARVSPEDKVRIVKAYRKDGDVVAMIGDGVNDAPALKDADIGVSVGSGTDVAKSAADLILLDNSFATLVAAIAEGRRILGNIRKVIVYLLSSVADSLFLIGGAMLTGLPLPLSALQILFVNFFSDSFPAIAYAFEEGVDPLGTKPKKLHHNLLDREMRLLVLIVGVITSTLLFALYFVLLRAGHDPVLVRTFTFAAFATYTLFLSFALRSLELPIWKYNPLSNPYLVLGSGIGLVLTFLVLYFPPLQGAFDTVSMPLPWLAGVIAVGLFNIAVAEFGKWLCRE
jgi:Ca2+-transporting ATPase